MAVTPSLFLDFVSKDKKDKKDERILKVLKVLKYNDNNRAVGTEYKFHKKIYRTYGTNF